MRNLKKRNILRTIYFFATLLLSLGAVASGQSRDEGTCSMARVAGEWGYTETGTLILPSGAVPFASVGKYTVDPEGNLSGKRNGSEGGKIQEATVKGTATVNSDCTGTIAISLYDPSGNLLNTVVKALVYVDNAREARAIVTSVVLPDGTSVPPVITMNAKKVLRKRGNEHQE